MANKIPPMALKLKNNPELARELAKKGGGRKRMTDLEKKESALQRKMLAEYKDKLEIRASRLDSILDRIEKELLKARIDPQTGKKLPLSEGKLELLIKYQKQLHEQVLGKPKQQVENTGNVPVTVVIHEEQELIQVAPVKIIDVKPEIPVVEIQEETDDSTSRVSVPSENSISS